MLVISYWMVRKYNPLVGQRFEVPVEFCGKFENWEHFNRFTTRQSHEGRAVFGAKLEKVLENDNVS